MLISPMTWSWLEAVFLLSLASTSSGRSVDLTLQRDSMGADVVRSVQSKLDDANVFNEPSDLAEMQTYELFLRESAFVESMDGTQYPLGVPDGGIWRMSREAFEQTTEYNYPMLFNAICEAFCIDWSSVNYDELGSPLYSGLAMRIFLHHLYITNRTLLETSTDMDKAVFWVTQFGESRLTAQWISRVEQLRTVEVCRVDTDAVFVLDSSGSIGPDNYQIVRDYAYNFTENLLSGNSNSRVGVILYSDSANVEIELNNTREPQEILQGIRNLPYLARYTNTPEGLCLLESMPWRSSVSVLRIAIVLTDGISNRESVHCAQDGVLGTVNSTAARVHSLQPPVTVFAVGVSNYVIEELLVIATSPMLIDELDSFDYRLLLQNQRSRGYFICFKEQQPISVGNEENGAVAMDTITRLEFSGSGEDGVTVKICINRGAIIIYGSYTTPNPNSALHDFSDILTASDGEVAPSECSVHHVDIDDIDPNLPDCNQCNTPRRKRRQSDSEETMVRVYISIEGASSKTESLFTVNSSNGNAFECADGFCGANREVVRRGVTCFCECIQGYELIGLECLNVDECITTPGVCGANAACLDTEGNYTCHCNPGYRTSGHVCIENGEDFFRVSIYVVLIGALFAAMMVIGVIGVLACRYKDAQEWKH